MPAEMDDDLSEIEDDEVVAVAAPGSSTITTTATTTSRLRPRAASVSSAASSLTDPEDLELLDETEDENADDEIIEINSDGSNKASARIAELVKRPPSEPKHRWETAVRTKFARFIHRKPTKQRDSLTSICLCLDSTSLPLFNALPRSAKVPSMLLKPSSSSRQPCNLEQHPTCRTHQTRHSSHR
jgi:hypothetical protein